MAVGARARQIGRWVAIAAGGLLVCAVLFAITLYVLLQTSGAKSFLEAWLNDFLSTPGEEEIVITGLGGALPHHIQVDRIEISDGEGVWLSLSGLDLAWRPFALFSGRIAVTRLTADRIDLARLPEAAEEEKPAEEDFSLPLPLLARLSIEEVRAEAIHLAPAVAGEAVTFRLAGGSTIKEGAYVTSVGLDVLEGEAGSLSWQSSFRPADEHLAINFDADAAPDGPLMRLMGFERQRGFARLEGEGPLGAWHGGFEAGLEGYASLESDVTLTEDEALRILLDGQANLRGLEEESLGALAGDTPRFRISALWDKDETLVIDSMRLDGRALTLVFDGALKAASGGIGGDLALSLKEDAQLDALAPGASIGKAAVNASLSGSLPWPDVAAQLEGDALAVEGFSAEKLSADLTIKRRRSLIGADGAQRDILLFATLEGAKSTEFELPGGGLVTARAEGIFNPQEEALTDGLIALEGLGARLDGTGQFHLAEESGEADLRLSAENLAFFAPMAGVDLSGAGEARFDLSMPGPEENTRFGLSAVLKEFGTGIEAVDALTGGSLKLRAEGEQLADGAFTFPEIEAEAAHLSLEGGFDANARGVLGGQYRFDVPRMQVLNDALGARFDGPLAVKGDVSGTGASPATSGEVSLAGAGTGDLMFSSLRLRFDGENLLAAPQGGLRLSGQSEGGPLNASLRYRVTEDVMRLADMSLSLGAANAQGGIEVPLDGAPMTGSLTIAAEDISPLLKLAALRGEGALAGKVQVSGAGGGQSATLDMAVRDPVIADASEELLSGAALRLQADAHDLMNAARFTANLEGEELRMGNARLEKTTLTAEGEAADFAFTAALEGRFKGPLSLQAEGGVQSEGEMIRIRLSSFEGMLTGRPIKLARETLIETGPRHLAINQAELDFGEATLRADMRSDARSFNIDASIDALDIAALDAFWATGDLAGVISASFSADGPRRAPQGSYRLSLADLSRASEDEMPKATFDMRGEWNEGRLASTVLFGEGAAEPQPAGSFDVALVLPQDGAVPQVPQDAPLSGRLSWEGEIGTWWALVPLDAHRLRGRTQINVQVEGTARDPDVEGQIALSSGAYENLDLGLLLRDFTVEAALRDSEFMLSRFTGTDGNGGTLSAKGGATIDPEENFPFELETEFSKFTALRRDDLTGKASGAVTLSGDAVQAQLEGNIQTDGVLVRIPEHFPPEVAKLDVVERGRGIVPPEEREGAEEEEGMTLGLDLGISLPKRVFVRGRGLDSEWEGNLQVTGTSADPRVTGTLSVVRGYFSILTKTFTIKSGQLTFRGSPDLVPEIDVLAENRSNDITVNVRATGQADDPDIELSSIPSLPDEEIVSRMLFGKSRGNLSAFEAAQLALAVGELTGVTGGGPGILDFARGALGVDVLRVDGGENEGTSVEAGSYVAEGVYIGLRKGITDETGAVSVEVELTPNISLSSETGSTGENDVGIQFKWDY